MAEATQRDETEVESRPRGDAAPLVEAPASEIPRDPEAEPVSAWSDPDHRTLRWILAAVVAMVLVSSFALVVLVLSSDGGDAERKKKARPRCRRMIRRSRR